MNLRFLIVTLILPVSGFCQLKDKQKEVFKEEFNKVADTFEKNLKPYLLKFSEQQYKPDVQKADPEQQYKPDVQKADPLLLTVAFQIYTQKARFIREEGFQNLIFQLDSGILIDQKMVIGYFDLSYRNNFPGLDYIFFEKCADELKKQKGQK